MIAIDPGHSGRYRRSVDRATGLRDIDYPNYPEIYEMFDVSRCVARGLRTDGYRVVLTKRRVLDTVGLAARADVANRAGAALAISVHNDHGQGPDFQATYDQRGLPDADGRYHAMYRGAGSARTVFDRPAVARRSQRHARIIARARAEAQGRPVRVRENTFTGRAPLEPGNLAIVQLLAEVPWVYNEFGARTGRDVTTPMTRAAQLGYARGLLAGVQRAVPLSTGVVPQPSVGAAGLRGCLVEAAAERPVRYRPRR